MLPLIHSNLSQDSRSSSEKFTSLCITIDDKVKVLFVCSGNKKFEDNPIVTSQGHSLREAGLDLEYFFIKRCIMLANMATTKMSSKGQVVIPEIIRKALGLESGCQFLVLGEKDAVILKTISAPSQKEVNRLLSKARKEAKKAGLKSRDISNAIRKVRGKK